MSSDNVNINFNDLWSQLETIEKQCPHSTLSIYEPRKEHEQFFNDLCRDYLDALDEQRAQIRMAVSDKEGVLNCLLGYVYKSARHIHSAADKEWLRIGLAAASIQDCRLDYRDFLLALADLYVSAEEAGLDPRAEFSAVAALSSRETPRGGTTPVSEMLANFHTYAVLGGRPKKSKRDR